MLEYTLPSLCDVTFVKGPYNIKKLIQYNRMIESTNKMRRTTCKSSPHKFYKSSFFVSISSLIFQRSGFGIKLPFSFLGKTLALTWKFNSNFSNHRRRAE